MRCFIGIDLPKYVKKTLSKFQELLRKENIFYGKYVEENNLHISLKFLGEINNVEGIKNQLKKIKFNPFIVSLNTLGAFPSENYIRLFYIKINKGKEEMINLHKEIEKILEFERDINFEPHVSLIRVKNVLNKKRVEELFKKEISFGEFNVTSFYLFKSTLTSNGPIYEKIEKIEL